jgi:hypothetical protein
VRQPGAPPFRAVDFVHGMRCVPPGKLGIFLSVV